MTASAAFVQNDSRECPSVKRLHVGVIRWQREIDELSASFAATLNTLGHTPIALEHDDEIPDQVDALIACGPYGPLVPLARRLARRSPTRRPALIVWQTEQFWNPGVPDWIGRPLSLVRSGVERAGLLETPGGRTRYLSWVRPLMRRAHRYRYLGDLLWMQEQGVLSVLAVGSRWNAEFMRRMGLSPLIAYVGSHPLWGADLGLERDIPVLWFGKPGSRRRERLLAHIHEQLGRHGVQMLLIDGVARPFIFGDERTRILNRTRIVLNVLRQPWDENAMRYYVAAPNRAAIVSEPTLPHVPFVNGEHLVEAPVPELVSAIRALLADEPRRQTLADRAHALVTTELTMARGVHEVLARAVLARTCGASSA